MVVDDEPKSIFDMGKLTNASHIKNASLLFFQQQTFFHFSNTSLIDVFSFALSKTGNTCVIENKTGYIRTNICIYLISAYFETMIYCIYINLRTSNATFYTSVAKKDH